MNYTIFLYPQVTPRYITVHGPTSDETVLNPGGNPGYPVEATLLYSPPDFDKYSDGNRYQLLLDPHGKATSAEIFVTFPDIREPKAQEIRTAGAVRLLALTTPYSAEERESWANQQKEAEAWTLNNSAPVPMITAMATARGITIAVMVGKIMDNVDLFRAAAGQILGTQQALLDQIYAATDFDTMRAITWPN